MPTGRDALLVGAQHRVASGAEQAWWEDYFGIQVTKSSTLATDPDALFDVTGTVAVTLLIGEVTSVVATTTSMHLTTSVDVIDLCASTQITTDADGTMYIVSGDPADTLNAGTPTLVGALVTGDQFAPMILGNDNVTDVILMQLNATGTGLITWTLFYIPLTANGTVSSAT